MGCVDERRRVFLLPFAVRWNRRIQLTADTLRPQQTKFLQNGNTRLKFLISAESRSFIFHIRRNQFDDRIEHLLKITAVEIL